MLNLKRHNYSTAIILLSALLMLVSCGRNHPSDSEAEEAIPDSEAEEIIHDFWQGDYEYTQAMYYKAGEERNKPYGEIHGKLISNPYQQYEQAADASEQGIVEQYWYMQDGQVVYNFKTPAANAPSHWTTIRSGEKGSCVYIKEELSFAFDREETISGRKVSVYRAQSEEEYTADYSKLPKEDRNGITEITIPYTMDVDYYIDFSQKEVARIRLDVTGSAKASAVASRMFSGMTREEAEQELRENGIEETWEIIYDIKNFNGEIEIDAPEDLKEL